MKRIKYQIFWGVLRVLRALFTRGFIDGSQGSEYLIKKGIHPAIARNMGVLFRHVPEFQSTQHYENLHKRKVVYTCVTGFYDNVKEPLFTNADTDYILFTDNEDIAAHGWTIKKLDNHDKLSDVKLARRVKLLPQEYLENYKESIWVDANMSIVGDITLLFQHLEDADFALFEHSQGRKCLYEEAKAVINLHKDNKTKVNKQVKVYREKGFPRNFGLFETGILIRRHYDPELSEAMKAWWNELYNNSHRDQLSLSFIIWHCGLKFKPLKGSVRNNYFTFTRNHKNS